MKARILAQAVRDKCQEIFCEEKRRAAVSNEDRATRVRSWLRGTSSLMPRLRSDEDGHENDWEHLHWLKWAHEVKTCSTLGQSALAPLITEDPRNLTWLVAGCIKYHLESGQNLVGSLRDWIIEWLRADPARRGILQRMQRSKDEVESACARVAARVAANGPLYVREGTWEDV